MAMTDPIKAIVDSRSINASKYLQEGPRRGRPVAGHQGDSAHDVH